PAPESLLVPPSLELRAKPATRSRQEPVLNSMAGGWNTSEHRILSSTSEVNSLFRRLPLHRLFCPATAAPLPLRGRTTVVISTGVFSWSWYLHC
ncbi:hypothetical protein BgiBS90_008956, partial [Biomphalaria glabrata]